MSNSVIDYHPLWEKLGMDLPAHDMLLSAVGEMYSSVFLSQKNRPRKTDYLDQSMMGIHSARIAELDKFREEGGKVFGTYCLYVPEEIVRAGGGVQVSLCSGAEWATDLVEQYVPRNTCGLIKSFMGFKLAHVCPYIESSDLIVGETTCDGKKKAYEQLAKLHNFYLLELPQKKQERDLRLWIDELKDFVRVVEKTTGKEITVASLQKAIEECNAKRAALQRLNRTRAAALPPISGLDSLLSVQIGLFDDTPRFTEKMNELAADCEQRVKDGVGVVAAGTRRLMVTGTPMALPNSKIYNLIEKSGAIIVCEEMCTGSRYYKDQVDASQATTMDELIEAVARKYFGINCACFTPNEERLQDIVEMAKAYHVDGVIDCSLQFCNLYESESYLVGDALKAAGIPCLRMSTDYSQEDLGQLQTRLDAFLEIIG